MIINKKFLAKITAALMTISMTGCFEAFADSKPGDISMKTCVCSPSYTTISWNGTNNAEGYELQYKKSGDGSYTKVTTSKTNYQFNNMSDTTYNFKIRAYNGSSNGNWTEFKFANFKPTATFKVWYNSQSGATQLRCTDVTNITLNGKSYKVTGYQAAKKENGNYSLLKTITDTTYSVTSISEPHQTKVYAMRYYTNQTFNGININYFGDYKDMSVTPTPSITNDVFARASGNDIILSWTIPSGGSDGYRIYVASKKNNKPWSNFAYYTTVKDGTAKSYTFKGEEASAYKFKIASTSFNSTYAETKQRNENESQFSDTVFFSTEGYKCATPSYATKVYSFKNYDGLILVGDSRTEYMSKTSNITINYPNTRFIGLAGSGYSYLNDTAIPKLKEYLSDGRRYLVVFNHGVNDLDNIEKYKALYKTIINDPSYSNDRFYFMSVNPIFDGCRMDRNSEGFRSTNIKIKGFNAEMKDLFGSNRYIDSNNYMTSMGYDSYDGIHYTDDCNRTIIRFIINTLYTQNL